MRGFTKTELKILSDLWFYKLQIDMLKDKGILKEYELGNTVPCYQILRESESESKRDISAIDKLESKGLVARINENNYTLTYNGMVIAKRV